MLSPQIEALLAECANEPIRYPGKVQPHGALLIVNRQDLTVSCASENTQLYLGLEAAALLGQPLTSRLELEPELLRCVRGHAERRSGLYSLSGHELAVRVHVSDTSALMELQPRTDAASCVAQDAAGALAEIHAAPDAQSAIDRAVNEVQRLVGYDRVMAYRFDDRWNGQVIAERTAHGTTPFLGLRYPASDIPAQARALYAQHWLRIIPDVHYAPVPLVARDPSALASVDLGDAMLRSVSPVHIEYLKNMGVAASLSISIRCGGALWGLIACHHGQPRNVGFELLERCELVGCVLSAKLEAEQARERARAHSTAASAAAGLLQRVREVGDIADALLRAGADLLALVQAGGAAVLHRGALRTFGQTPDQPQLEALVAWLDARGIEELATAELHEQHPSARDYAATGAGLLCVSLPDTQPAFLMWFRPEVVRIVNWGGDPQKPVQVGAGELSLGPRRSFELWKETVRLTSHPWSDAEREAAVELRRGLIEMDLHRQLRRAQEQRRALEQSNRELDGYAHVIAHDLLAPLRGIVAFSQKMQRELSDGQLEQASQRAELVNRSAVSLANLVHSLHEYSRCGRVELGIEDTDLNSVVEQELQRLAPFLAEQGAEVRIAGPLPVVRCDRVRVGQVLGNLISNAVKYNLSPAKLVRIYSDGAQPPTIFVADNGIGIEAKYRDDVFHPFRRLQGQDEFGGGSGMGLSIAHKIVERHGGRMWIEDTREGGTTIAFTLAPAC